MTKGEHHVPAPGQVLDVQLELAQLRRVPLERIFQVLGLDVVLDAGRKPLQKPYTRNRYRVSWRITIHQRITEDRERNRKRVYN